MNLWNKLKNPKLKEKKNIQINTDLPRNLESHQNLDSSPSLKAHSPDLSQIYSPILNNNWDNLI